MPHFENRPPRDRASDLSFGIYSTDEIRRMSVTEIFRPETFDELQHPIVGGLYDPNLGAIEGFSECLSCGGRDVCPGHVGHIELPVPVYNPFFFLLTYNLLRGTCFNCHRLFTGAASLRGRVIMAQLQCLRKGLITMAGEIQTELSKALGDRVEDDQQVNDAENESEGKKRRSKKSHDLVEEGFDIESEQKLQTLVAEALKKTGIDPDATISSHQTRNIQVIKQSIVREFCSNVLYQHKRKCPHCRRAPAQLSKRGYDVVIIGSGQSKKKLLLKKDEPLGSSFNLLTGTNVEDGKKKGRTKSIKKELSAETSAKPLDDESVQDLISDMLSGSRSAETAEVFDDSSNERRILSPIQARKHLRLVWEQDGRLLESIFPMFVDNDQRKAATSKGDFCPLDLLFLDVVPVPPPNFRPLAVVDGAKHENRQTTAFRRVVEMSAVLKHFVSYSRGGNEEMEKQLSEQIIARVRGRTFEEKFQMTYITLQSTVNGLFDGVLSKSNFARATDQSVGLRQILEKKEGLFRMNMMGKRVNYACRTVITPDPYMDVDGIGIPDIFARKLTFPTPVNQVNLADMRRAVMNGPANYPGANFVTTEYGQSTFINESNVNDRHGIAKRLIWNDKRALLGPKKVYRHLLAGDYMLLNRQPTLHKPSMMAHKVHILRNQKTMRLNYSACKTYNADFDGDEMNAHFPQDFLARAECEDIIPKDGSPLAGLIQDHIVSGVLLTLKDKFFSKQDYEYLVLSAFGFLNRSLRTLPPAIWKPAVRWTGKQIVSTVILNVIPAGYPLINLDGKAKTALKNWQTTGFKEPEFDMSESHVIFRNCELLLGVLDKAHYGPTAYGLVHSCYELYGPRVACSLLSCFSRLFTTYLQLHGFTLGVADVLVGNKADKKRKKISKQLRSCGRAVMKEVFNVNDEQDYERTLEKAYSKKDRSDIKHLDFSMKSQTDQVNDQVNKACLPHGLVRLFPTNGLLLMIECGAKGTMVNSMQMSCMLGQIELEGCRPSITPSGRSLPSFKPYDHLPRAGGFVAQRFLTGVKPQEFFFHCMAGREGLIDTAVKTSRSGYLQRCLIKHLESVVVNYDLTVRDADKSVIQFQYGEDGLDIGKVQYLQGEKQLQFLLDNRSALQRLMPTSEQLEQTITRKTGKHYKKITKWLRKHSSGSQFSKSTYERPFTVFSRNFAGSDTTKEEIINDWYNLDEESLKILTKRYGTRCPDPVAFVRNPCAELGAVSERLLDDLAKMEKITSRWDVFDEYRRAVYWKAMKALAEPGEAVGLLAAQSIGEPSTQMTLNTFHFAGRGEMNVTLGIPRLREILMTASEKISTPSAKVPFLAHVTQEQAKELHRRMNNIYLDQVLESIETKESLTLTASKSYRQYVVTLTLSKPKSRPYSTSHLACLPILRKVEKSFFKRVTASIKKTCDNNLMYVKGMPAGREKTRGRVAREDKEDDGDIPELPEAPVEDDAVSDDERDAMDNAETDASDARLRQRHNDENDYVGEEEEQAEVVGKREEESESEQDENESHLNETVSETFDADQGAAEINYGSKEKMNTKESDSNRITVVSNCSSMIKNYEYDVKRNRWCRITIHVPYQAGSVDMSFAIQDEAKRFVVQGLPSVQRCILSEKDGGQFLITEGINLQAIFEKANYFDVNKVYCNNIHYMAQTYGIEAALKTLIKETQGVFGNYGITVDYRHLSLVADYMMHTGSYQPFNRIYMGTSTSPFQKMSFETTIKFLRDALESGEVDDLNSTSASIVAGQTPKIGTGFFDVLVKLK